MAAQTLIFGKSCFTPGCRNPAKLRCPTCIKLKLEDSFFCSQDCFRGCWQLHKIIHSISNMSVEYNPWPFYKFTGALRPAPLSERRVVSENIARPDYADDQNGVSLCERNAPRGEIKVLNEEEVAAMRVACKLAREVLDEGARACGPGVTTDEIDRVVHEACIDRDCYPSPLGYYKFPKSVCTSVNEVICHGIPDTRKLVDGDICNVDVTVFHRGFHGDVNETFLVGETVDAESRKLVTVAYECLEQAIQSVRPGMRFRDIGGIIQKHANSSGFSVVRSFCGHGIHRLFHAAPKVPHYAKNKEAGVMRVGNTFTIEPMINAGTHQEARWPDEWTAVTADGKRSAQFEHTLLVTEAGCEVLTGRGSGRPWFLDQLEEKYSS